LAPLGLCYNRRLWQEWLQSKFGGEKKVLYGTLAEELELEQSGQWQLEGQGQIREASTAK
jgi:hypothetical protein